WADQPRRRHARNVDPAAAAAAAATAAGEVCAARLATMTADQSPEDAAAECQQACDYDDQALISAPRKTHPLTPTRIATLLTKAIVHPVQALVDSVSFGLVWLQGDPAAPLWAYIDDYAFPERIDPLARPAGRTAQDHTQAKSQPGSLVDILRFAARNIPRGLRGMASEFFMDFSIPRAHLDSSVVSYPKAMNTEAAFASTRKSRRSHRQPAGDSEMDEKLGRDASAGIVGDQEDQEPDDASSLSSGSTGELARQSSRSVSGTVDMNYSLAPATSLPATFVARIHEPSPPAAAAAAAVSSSGSTEPPRIHRTTTYVPRIDPRTGKIVAMQYQADSSELPHGTRMNRKYTDFSQPNMSYLKGILDSTHFSYLHPGLYGDLPSLWLPVQNLRKRKELKRSARQRLHDARDALESAIQDNFLGKDAVGKIYEASQAIRQRVAASNRSSRRLSTGQGGDAGEKPSDAPMPESLEKQISRMDVRRKMEDMYVEGRCSRLGIDPRVLRHWDPTGLHDCCRGALQADDVLEGYGRGAEGASLESTSVMETDEDMGSLDQLSASESDNSDTETTSSVGIRAVEEGSAR
ncbi:hypothetical protein LPJ56_001202, partial [Coemansia sp. RSA 2599]